MAQKRSFFPRYRLLAAVVAGCFGGNTYALPTGAQVAAGTAAISQAGNMLTVHNSANAILNWQQFSIAASEAVRFNQPSASSSVLNRVLGADPSNILGQLSSNGRVWLVNPAGILVGPGARIDTAGFVASTLNVSNENFLAGKLTFGGNGNAGSVVNQGAIATSSGGSVYLIAPNVGNEGVITTPHGETILAAGQTVQLLDTATPGVKVEITGAQGDATNLGSIVAEAGRIGMAGVLVKNSGTLNASSVVSEGGRIFLKATQDTYVEGDAKVQATGSHGGRIEALGNRVAVTGNAVLDASGQNGGGDVLVGGDFQGKNPEVRNAAITYFGPQATLTSDAVEQGNGGKVIVWSDDVSRAFGMISARGGKNSGNGGFVETSGHRYLDFRARVDTRAPHGSDGMLLLDPADIAIDTSGEVLNGGSFGAGVFSGATGNSVLTWGTINAQSGSLEIRTNSAGAGGNGDININASGTVTGPTSLTLLANGNITVANAVSVSGAGEFNLIAGWNNTGWAVTPGVGTINLGSGSTLSSTGSNVTLSAGSNIAISGLVSSTTGSIGMTSQSGSITTGAGGSLRAGTITLNAGGTIGTSPASRLLFGAPPSPTSVVIGNTIAPTGLYTDMPGSITYGNITTAGPIDIVTNGGTLTFAGDVTSGNNAISIKSSSNLTLNAGKTINAGSGTIGILGSSFGANLDGALTTANNSANAVVIKGISGSLTLGNVNSAGGVCIGEFYDIQGDIYQNGGTTISGTSVKMETQGNLALQAISAPGGAVTLRALGDITDGNAATNNVTAGTLDVRTRGSFDSNINVSGNASFGKLYTSTGAEPTNAAVQIDPTDLIINTVPIGTINAGGINYVQGRNVVQAINGFPATGVVAYQASGGAVSLVNETGNTITVALDGVRATTATTGLTAGSNTPTTSASATNIGASTVGGTLGITNTGNISQSGALTVTGATTLSAGTGNITLTNASNDFVAGVTASGANVSLRDGNALSLAGITATGTASLEAGGNITQSAAIAAPSLAVKTTNGSVTLDTVSNTVSNLAGQATGAGVYFKFKNGATALNVADVDGVSGVSAPGMVALTSGGALTQSVGSLVSGTSAYLEGTKVILTEPNPVGVISGKATGSSTGDIFSYKSSNAIFLDAVNGFSGIQTAMPIDAFTVFLNGGSGGISQNNLVNSLINAGGGTKGVSLTTTGPVSLTKSTNNVSELTVTGPVNGLTYYNAGTLTFNGVSTTANQPINVSLFGGTALTVMGAVNAGTGSVQLSGPNLHLGSGAPIAVTGGSVSFTASQANGTINQFAGGTVTGSTYLGIAADNLTLGAGSTLRGGTGAAGSVSIAPVTAGRAIEVAGAAPTGGTLSITQAHLGMINPAATGITGGFLDIGNAGGSSPITVKGSFTAPGSMVTRFFGKSISQDAGAAIHGSIAVNPRSNASDGAAAFVTLTEPTNQIDSFAIINQSNPTTSVSLVTDVPSLTLMGGTSIGIYSTRNIGATGNVSITNTGGSMAVNAAIAGANVSLQSTGSITLQTTNSDLSPGTITASGGTVTLNAGGSIIDANGPGTNNVTASSLTATAGNGLSLDTAVSTLTATNTSTGPNGIAITNTGNLLVNGIVDSSVGDPSIYGPSTCSGGTPPAVCAAGIKLKNLGGTLTLDSSGVDSVSATGAYAPVRIGSDSAITIVKPVKGHAVGLRTLSLTDNAAISTVGAVGPGRHVDVWTDALVFGVAGSISAADGINIATYSASKEISIASSSCTDCLLLSGSDLSTKIIAPQLAIGNDIPGGGDITENVSGPIFIKDAINRSGGKIAFLSGGAITQDAGVASQIIADGVGAITTGTALGSDVSLGHASNQFTGIIGKTAGGAFNAKSATSLTVSSHVDAIDPADSIYGISTSGGAVTLASGGSITSSALGVPVSASSLTATAATGIGTLAIPLRADVGTLSLTNTSTGDIRVISHTAGSPAPLNVALASSLSGGVFIENFGQLTTGATLATPVNGSSIPIRAGSGDISLTAHSPVTIGAGGADASGNITLTAGSAGSSSSVDIVTLNGPVTAGGTLTLAGYDAVVNIPPTATSIASQVYVVPPPTLAECTTNPSLSGCDAILPSLATCTASPTTAGCTAVLPSLATCTAAPTTAGCSAILPSLATCTTDPTTAGCTAVLPTLATCTAASATAGCSAILPSLATCTSDPATAGCTAVLPSLATCTATPTTAGCSVILPSLATCTTAPATTGCSAVLPTLTACTLDPKIAGCTAVLPSLAACTTSPTTAGCTAVLPPLADCTVNPTATGCAAVLPTLSVCIASPTTAGCTAVLPSLATCTALPTTGGCTAVLPSLATCTTDPAAIGCSVILPSLATCTATPTTAGCAAVLPSIAACTSSPTTIGCSAVLPSLATCTATPSAAGCTAVLPSLATCMTSPSAPGCTAVLPSLAACATAPATVGCSAVLPTLAACMANPGTAGCGVVLPTLASCTTNPAQEGCSAVLPSLASCSSNPTQDGCSVVLPPVTATNPTVAASTNEVVAVAAAVTSTTTSGETTATTAAPPPPPPPPPAATTGTAGTTTLALLNTNQTIGGTEGTFGGTPSPAVGTSGSTTVGTGTGTAGAGTVGGKTETTSAAGGTTGAATSGSSEGEKSAPAKSAAADKSSSDKSSGEKSSNDKSSDKPSEEKKEEKKEKDEKKDGADAKKEERKVAKKPAVCN